jgi:exonuclease SbcC
VKGFTCFKDEQVLDFEGLDLFAMAGPMGAGKSSLLDAMIYAMYGKVPRVGKTYSELVSHGRDRMSITLDFRVGERHLRVTRTGRRTGAARAQLEEIIDGTEKPIADAVRTVDAEIERIVGLDYEAFTQAVVLPQGEFANFLRGEPRARRKILSDLLRLHIYERMRKRALAVRDQLEGDVILTEKRLNEDYGGATQDALRELRERALTLGEQNEGSASRLKEEKEKHQHIRELHEKTEELLKNRKQQRELVRQEPEILKSRERLTSARKGVAVVPLLDQADTDEKESLRARNEAVDARQGAERLRRVDERVRGDLKKAEREAQKLPAMNKRIQSLDELKGKVEARDRERARKEKAQAELSSLLEQAKEARSKEKDAAAEVKKQERARDAATATVRDSGFDGALAERLEAVRDDAVQTRELRTADDDADGAAREAEASAARNEGVAKQATKDADAAVTELEQSKNALTKADAELHAAEHEEMVSVLQGELRAGEECPVCGQPVRQVPESRRNPRLELLRKNKERAMKTEGKARAEASRRREEAASAESAARSARNDANRKGAAAEVARKRLATAVQRIEERAGKDVADVPGRAVEERVLRLVKSVDGARKAHEKAAKALHDSEKAHAAAEATAKRASDKVKTIDDRCGDKKGIVSDVTANIADLDEQIAKVTHSADPISEREALAEECSKIDEVLKKAQQAAKDSGRNLAVADERASGAGKASEKAQKTAADSKQRALDAASKVGFRDISEVRTAALSPTVERQLEDRVETFERNKSAVERRVSELLEHLAGREVSGEEFKKSAAAVSELERELQEIRDNAAKLKEQMKNLEAAVEKASVLNSELLQKRARHALYAELELSLHSDRFQDYVLDEAFGQLVAGASRRLMELSGRYELAVNEGLFRVIDHDNALEQRSADTLSGGETFLASLALALELSQQVQRAAGAVQIDSLFIDEGFGTLDPETLDTVASAVEALPVGGRLVGIITHVRELTERLPARVIVEKGSEGSRVRRERD